MAIDNDVEIDHHPNIDVETSFEEAVMGCCACWEMKGLVEVVSASHVGGGEVEVEYSCPCCSGGLVRPAVVDVELVADAAMRLLSQADLEDLFAVLRCQGVDDPAAWLAEAALELLEQQILDPVLREEFNRVVFGQLDATSCQRKATRLRTMPAGVYRTMFERAARCLLVVAGAAAEDEADSKAAAELEAMVAALDAFERRAA